MTCSPPYSKVNYTLTLVTVGSPTFTYSAVPLLEEGAAPEPDQLIVYVNNVPLTLDTDYTVDTTMNTITVIGPAAAALVVGDVLSIQRDTNKCELYVDFTNNDIINEADLDLNFNQVFFIAQEAYDLAFATIRMNPDERSWNGRSLEARTFGPAQFSDSLVTLGQVRNMVAGFESASSATCTTYGFDGDGSTTQLPLTGDDVPPDINSCQILVTVDGVVLEPDCEGDDGLNGSSELVGDQTNNSGGCGAYEVQVISGIPTIVFATPPANGTHVSVRTLTGIFAGTVGDGTITTAKLANRAVTAAKMSFGTSPGEERRVVHVDSAGTPYATTLTASGITDFNTAVRTNKLNQMSLPDGFVAFNNQQIRQLQAGTDSNHAVNKGQFDSGLTGAYNNITAAYTAAISAALGSVTALPPNVNNSMSMAGTVTLGASGTYNFVIPLTTAKRQAAFDALSIFLDQSGTDATNFPIDTGTPSYGVVILCRQSWMLAGNDSFPEDLKVSYWDNTRPAVRETSALLRVTRNADGFTIQNLGSHNVKVKFTLLLNPTV